MRYNGELKRQGERVGFIVVCPKGRDTASMYRGSAEQDVIDVLAEVRRDYKVDAARIYLMGHSMGGYGTWSVAMNHPEVFAALGPISGGGIYSRDGEDREYSAVCGPRGRRPDCSRHAIARHGGSRQEGRREHRLRGGPGREPHQRCRAAVRTHAGLFCQTAARAGDVKIERPVGLC